ncbi:MAG: hypothetical protein MHM6MM_003833 [Cercozoa sp. M6MM]
MASPAPVASLPQVDLRDDGLNVGGHPHILKMLERNGVNEPDEENVYFTEMVTKISRHGKDQTRVLLITQKALYLTEPNNYKKCKARVPIDKIRSVGYTDTRNEFVLRVPTDSDHPTRRFRSRRHARIIALLSSFHMALTGRRMRRLSVGGGGGSLIETAEDSAAESRTTAEGDVSEVASPATVHDDVLEEDPLDTSKHPKHDEVVASLRREVKVARESVTMLLSLLKRHNITVDERTLPLALFDLEHKPNAPEVGAQATLYQVTKRSRYGVRQQRYVRVEDRTKLLKLLNSDLQPSTEIPLAFITHTQVVSSEPGKYALRVFFGKQHEHRPYEFCFLNGEDMHMFRQELSHAMQNAAQHNAGAQSHGSQSHSHLSDDDDSASIQPSEETTAASVAGEEEYAEYRIQKRGKYAPGFKPHIIAIDALQKRLKVLTKARKVHKEFDLCDVSEVEIHHSTDEEEEDVSHNHHGDDGEHGGGFAVLRFTATREQRDLELQFDRSEEGAFELRHFAESLSSLGCRVINVGADAASSMLPEGQRTAQFSVVKLMHSFQVKNIGIEHKRKRLLVVNEVENVISVSTPRGRTSVIPLTSLCAVNKAYTDPRRLTLTMRVMDERSAGSALKVRTYVFGSGQARQLFLDMLQCMQKQLASSDKKEQGEDKMSSLDEVLALPLAQLLRKPATLAAFKDYAALMLCSENVIFWETAEVFRERFPSREQFEGDVEVRREQMQLVSQIHADYISSDAPFQVNIPGDMRENISAHITALSVVDLEDFKDKYEELRGMFDEAQQCITSLMEVSMLEGFKKYIRA